MKISNAVVESYFDLFGLDKCQKCTKNLVVLNTIKVCIYCAPSLLNQFSNLTALSNPQQTMEKRLSNLANNIEQILQALDYRSVEMKLTVDMNKIISKEFNIIHPSSAHRYSDDEFLTSPERGFEIYKYMDLMILSHLNRKRVETQVSDVNRKLIKPKFKEGTDLFEKEIQKLLIQIMKYRLILIQIDEINAGLVEKAYQRHSTKDFVLVYRPIKNRINLMMQDMGAMVRGDIKPSEYPEQGEIIGLINSFIPNVRNIDEHPDFSISNIEFVYLKISFFFSILTAYPSLVKFFNFRAVTKPDYSGKQITHDHLQFIQNKIIELQEYEQRHIHPSGRGQGLNLLRKTAMKQLLEQYPGDPLDLVRLIYPLTSTYNQNELSKILNLPLKVLRKAINDIGQIPLFKFVRGLKQDNGERLTGYCIDPMYLFMLQTFITQFEDFQEKKSMRGKMGEVVGDLMESDYLPKILINNPVTHIYYTKTEIENYCRMLGLPTENNRPCGDIDGIFVEKKAKEIWIIESKYIEPAYYGWINRIDLGYLIGKPIEFIKGKDLSYKWKRGKREFHLDNSHSIDEKLEWVRNNQKLRKAIDITDEFNFNPVFITNLSSLHNNHEYQDNKIICLNLLLSLRLKQQ